jgi:hypothetical protein
VKTLTTDLLVEAEQPPVVVEVEFPPVVELEEAVLTVGPPVLAALLCSTTTQLPKPDPEINCYDKSANQKKKRIQCQLKTYNKTLIILALCPRRELSCDGFCFSSWRRLAYEIQSKTFYMCISPGLSLTSLPLVVMSISTNAEATPVPVGSTLAVNFKEPSRPLRSSIKLSVTLSD